MGKAYFMMGGTLFSPEGSYFTGLRKAVDYYGRANFMMGGTPCFFSPEGIWFTGLRKAGDYYGVGQIS